MQTPELLKGFDDTHNMSCFRQQQRVSFTARQASSTPSFPLGNCCQNPQRVAYPPRHPVY